MTTTVTINAHLVKEKEVVVEINDNNSGLLIDKFTLQNGESAHRVIFDGREIKVSEIIKQ